MKRFSKILFCFDKSCDQVKAFDNAVALARNNQASLCLFDVIPNLSAGIGMLPNGPVSAQLVEWVRNERLKAFNALIKQADTQGVKIHQQIMVADKKSIEIIRTVQEEKYDLVIKAAEDPDWINRLFGSEDMHLLRMCPCPVWLIKNEFPVERRILAAIDFDIDADEIREQNLLNEQILSLALTAALSFDAEVHIVHAWESMELDYIHLWADAPENAKHELDNFFHSKHHSAFNAYVNAFKETIGKEVLEYTSIKTHLLQGNPSHVIPTLAKELNADLVVMGTINNTSLPALIIGNTAETVIDQLHCSLMGVKPAHFSAPF